MDILPAANGNCQKLEGYFTMPQCVGMDKNFPNANRIFIERLQRLGTYRLSQSEKQIIFYMRDEKMLKEAYCLCIKDNKIIISASGETGYVYGLTTLFQLLVNGNGTVQNCILEDSPRFSYRGIMLDVCRHFFSAEEVKKILEQMSLLKMNHFHWHLSDDQGYRIESRRFPALNKIGSYRALAEMDPSVQKGLAKKGDDYGGYYSQKEIQEIVEFAAERQIEIIPEISIPGHSSAILASFPEYTCSGKPMKVKSTFGVHERIFCAGKKECCQFLCEVLDEILELFPGRFIHLGGDEVPKTEWHDCPTCNRLMKERGLKSYEQLQAYFMGELIQHIKEKGKTPIVWHESVFSGNLDQSAVIQYWMEMNPGPSYVLPEIARGRKFILSSMNQFYCDYSYAEIPLRATLMYEPNIKGTTVPDENVLGIEAPMWTEWTPEAVDIEKMMYPRMLAVSECGWTKERVPEDFMQRAEKFLKKKEVSLLEPMPWEQATIHGQEALQMIAVKMLELGAKYGNMAQGENPEEVGKVEAVTPEDEVSQPMDMITMIRAYLTDRMQAAYTSEEIDIVMKIIVDIMRQADM